MAAHVCRCVHGVSFIGMCFFWHMCEEKDGGAVVVGWARAWGMEVMHRWAALGVMFLVTLICAISFCHTNSTLRKWLIERGFSVHYRSHVRV